MKGLGWKPVGPAGLRVRLVAHAHGLCLVVHMAGDVEARDCCACRRELCPACKEKPDART